uniref:Aldo-keto reductase family 1 member A1-like n=1 Tax=Diabrotica virgifera virgifera TaxID=50390 RepID=A0A6P7GBU3_DIAVI
MAVQMYMEVGEGQKMPSIGLGTWLCSDEIELEEALRAALETGYRHIDTAYFYDNEHIIGKIVNEFITEEKLTREEIFITTKLPIFGVHEDLVEEYMGKSLENLQMDYVDMYLVQFPVHMNYDDGLDNPQFVETDHISLWKKMEEQVDAGRTKAIGLSNFNINQLNRIYNEARIKPACLQIENHIYLQQRELVYYCQDRDIVVVGYSPFGCPMFNQFLSSIGRSQRDIPNLMQDPTVIAVAEKYEKTAAQILLRFQLQRDIVVIPKSVTPSRIEENFDVFDFLISEEDMEQLLALEVGEAARIVDYSVLSPKLADQLEWPWPTFSKASE